MITTGHALEAANAAAAEATTAFMLGRGLAAEIDDLRFPDDGPLIPAPGLDDLIRALGEAAGEACNAADRVPNLFDANARSVAVALARFENDRATKAVRRIAQVLLGVSSALGWNDAIARAERAAVSVLFPVDGPAVPLIADGLELTGQTRAALRTELSGALCRMVVDHNVALALGPWANPVAIILKVDAVGNITVSAVAPRGTEQEMTALGWSERSDDGLFTASYPDPPIINDAVTLVLDTLHVIYDVDEQRGPDHRARGPVKQSSSWPIYGVKEKDLVPTLWRMT